MKSILQNSYVSFVVLAVFGFWYSNASAVCKGDDPRCYKDLGPIPCAEPQTYTGCDTSKCTAPASYGNTITEENCTSAACAPQYKNACTYC